MRSWVLQCADSLALSLMAYGLIPTHSTFPGDPPERGRKHRHRLPVGGRTFPYALSPSEPQLLSPSATNAPVPHVRTDKEGCACDTEACDRALSSGHAARPRGRLRLLQRLQSARSRSKSRTRTSDSPSQTRGKHHFGYKSKAFNVVDDRLFTFWPLSGPFAPANRNDHLLTIPGFHDLARRFPGLHISEMLAMQEKALMRFCSLSTTTSTPCARSASATTTATRIHSPA